MSHKISKKELDTLVENFEQFEQVDPPRVQHFVYALAARHPHRLPGPRGRPFIFLPKQRIVAL